MLIAQGTTSSLRGCLYYTILALFGTFLRHAWCTCHASFSREWHVCSGTVPWNGSWLASNPTFGALWQPKRPPAPVDALLPRVLHPCRCRRWIPASPNRAARQHHTQKKKAAGMRVSATRLRKRTSLRGRTNSAQVRAKTHQVRAKVRQSRPNAAVERSTLAPVRTSTLASPPIAGTVTIAQHGAQGPPLLVFRVHTAWRWVFRAAMCYVAHPTYPTLKPCLPEVWHFTVSPASAKSHRPNLKAHFRAMDYFWSTGERSQPARNGCAVDTRRRRSPAARRTAHLAPQY